MEIEYSDKKGRVPAFLRRIREAEERGARFIIGQPIEPQLKEFETRGTITGSTTRNKLSKSDWEKIKQERLLEIERRDSLGREERMQELEERIRLRKKLEKLHATMEPTKKPTYLILK